MKGINIPILTVLIFSCILSLSSGFDFAHLQTDDSLASKYDEKSLFENLEHDIKSSKYTKENPLIVHLVPHTHDDVGYTKTADEYFSGTNQKTRKAGVRYILTSVIDHLIRDPTKKFTYVEMYFFQAWWNEQSDEIKKQVQTLVDRGQLQFVNAGITMSDEATVHYEDFINNMKAGHDFLYNALGYKPTIGWHIDPFGHHAASAALFAEMGFEAFVFCRIDYQDKDQRIQNREMEFVWRPFNNSLGSRAEIFSHLTYAHYGAPPSFEYWQQSVDPIIEDDPELETYNVNNRSADLHTYLINMGYNYRSNNLMVLLGGDFVFQNADKIFMNWDKLIKYVNEHYDDVKLIWSTPNEYIDAVHKSDVKWPTKYDDFFPYADQPNQVWSGYYTSRATIKKEVREASSIFSSHALWLAFDYLVNGADIYSSFKGLNEEIGVIQHHDGVSGTEKQHVADDYKLRIGRALDKERVQFFKSFKEISSTPLENLATCKAQNSTFVDCPTNILDNPSINELGIHIINPTTDRNTLAKIPIPHSKLELYDEYNKLVETDIIWSINSKESLKLAKDHENDGCHMYFKISVDTFGGQIFKLRQSLTANHIKPVKNKGSIITKDYKASIKSTRTDCKIEYTRNDIKDSQLVKLDYVYYTPLSAPIYPFDEGAYIFRPLWPSKQASRYDSFKSYETYQGKIVNQIRLYGKQLDTIITGHDMNDFLEIETQLHGLNWNLFGMDVTLRITNENIKSHKTFYTDSMCMQMMKRVKDYRPTYNLILNQPIASNFYPVGHGIYVKDDHLTLELLNDRSQSGSSLKDGQVELMLQRRLYHDDAKGLSEALNEKIGDGYFAKGIPITTVHHLRVYNSTIPKLGKSNSRFMQKEIDNPLQYIYGNFSSTLSNTTPRLYSNKNPLKINLPSDIKLVIQPQYDGKIFMRIENIADPMSSTASYEINVEDLAQQLSSITLTKLKSVTEVSMTGLFSMEEMKLKKRWKTLDFDTPDPDYSSDIQHIDLGPQRIRSFMIEFESSQSA